MIRLVLLVCLLGSSSWLMAQQSYKVGAIGFYNLENLFDTLDTPDVRDTEFTPGGAKLYNTAIYTDKLHKLASVIGDLATDITPDGISLLGVSEIENRTVLEDLVKQPELAARNYQIVHYDSPDERGIDVGLLYNPRYFTVTNSQAVPLYVYRDDGERNFTRDVLVVSGTYDGDALHVLVNHWPSRSGGEMASRPFRNAAALLNKQLADSIRQTDASAKIIIMGDLNDDPVSPSVKEIIAAESNADKLKKAGFYNPMFDFFRRGLGTLAYRDAWSLFDQILVNENLVNKRATGFRFYQAHIYSRPILFQKTGRYKGYPNRCFVGDTYTGGYSDHLPVYVLLIKEAG